jgi:hypothetical protein
MTSGRMHSGGMLLGAARIEAEAIRDAKAEGQPSPPSSTIAVALVDQARTKLPSVSHSYKGLWPEDHSRAAERRLVRGVGPLVAVRLVERCRQTPFQPGPELVVSPAQLRAVEQRGHVLG